jgi:TRAP-type C4-dicarboxylate transport system permease small subunit
VSWNWSPQSIPELASLAPEIRGRAWRKAWRAANYPWNHLTYLVFLLAIPGAVRWVLQARLGLTDWQQLLVLAPLWIGGALLVLRLLSGRTRRHLREHGVDLSP